LRPLQRLDRRLFVDTDDDGVLRRRDIEPNYIGGFGGEFGIVAFAPGFTPRKVDLLGAQNSAKLPFGVRLLPFSSRRVAASTTLERESRIE
jgi:hypothetical protein